MAELHSPWSHHIYFIRNSVGFPFNIQPEPDHSYNFWPLSSPPGRLQSLYCLPASTHALPQSLLDTEATRILSGPKSDRVTPPLKPSMFPHCTQVQEAQGTLQDGAFHYHFDSSPFTLHPACSAPATLTSLLLLKLNGWLCPLSRCSFPT